MARWKIRDLTIENQVLIAPLAGISNPAFRTIAKEFGAGLVYSEMISDKAIVYQNKKTLEMCRVEPTEHPIALQLFGEEIDSMVKAAIYLDTQTDCDIIDINMGCPVPKIVKGSGGASLMKTPEHAAAIVKAIVEAVKKPVTCKIRIGWPYPCRDVFRESQSGRNRQGESGGQDPGHRERRHRRFEEREGNAGENRR